MCDYKYSSEKWKRFPAESYGKGTVGWTLTCITDVNHSSYLLFHLTLIIPYHPFNFSPEVFRVQAVACPEAPHSLGPVAWQTTKSPQCWWGLIQGGVLHCWDWWWLLSGGPQPDRCSQSLAESQSQPKGPLMSVLLSKSLTLQCAFLDFDWAVGVRYWNGAAYQHLFKTFYTAQLKWQWNPLKVCLEGFKSNLNISLRSFFSSASNT